MRKFEIDLPIYLSLSVEAPDQERAVEAARAFAAELELGPPSMMNYTDGNDGTRITGSSVALLAPGEDDEPDVYPIDTSG